MSVQSGFGCKSSNHAMNNELMVSVESMDLNANGIAHDDGKVIFIEGALPQEQVMFQVVRKKEKYNHARLTKVLKASPLRVAPRCAFFGVCGGCSMQHVDIYAQVAIKQRVLEDHLTHLAKVQAETIFAPIYGPSWHYRYRARLSVRYVAKKGTVLIGFHEKKSRFVADMTSCVILPKHVSDLLLPLRVLITQLSIRDQLPQIELAVGEVSTVLVLRIMQNLSSNDEALLTLFSKTHHIQFWLQPKGPETAYPLCFEDPALFYRLPEFNLQIPFKPTDFTQVNHQINRTLIHRALSLLEIHATHRVLDLFCGIGNFTLPIARQASFVVGIEGSTILTERAQANAQLNHVAQRVRFDCRNLFEVNAQDILSLGAFDRVLMDPPRDGAMAICSVFAELTTNGHSQCLPERIVYVSCNPATLARDLGILVTQAGYRLVGAGVVNMFPHTSHVESIAVLQK